MSPHPLLTCFESNPSYNVHTYICKDKNNYFCYINNITVVLTKVLAPKNDPSTHPFSKQGISPPLNLTHLI